MRQAVLFCSAAECLCEHVSMHFVFKKENETEKNVFFLCSGKYRSYGLIFERIRNLSILSQFSRIAGEFRDTRGHAASTQSSH